MKSPALERKVKALTGPMSSRIQGGAIQAEKLRSITNERNEQAKEGLTEDKQNPHQVIGKML